MQATDLAKLELPDRFGQPDGTTAIPEEGGRHKHHPPAPSRLLKMLPRQPGFPALESKNMQTQALHLIDIDISKPFQDHDEKDMQTVELQVSILEQQQQQHLDRIHSACIPTFPKTLHINQTLQALADVTDRLNTFGNLPNSSAINLINLRIEACYSRRIETFLSTPNPQT